MLPVVKRGCENERMLPAPRLGCENERIAPALKLGREIDGANDRTLPPPRA